MAKVIMFEPGLQKMERMSADMAYNAAKQVAQEIRNNVGVETGELKSSVRARRLKRSSRVYIGTDHWAYHEYGVDPHIIRTVTRKVLTDRKKIYGKVVMHPGHRAYRPIRNAFYKRRATATLLIPEV